VSLPVIDFTDPDIHATAGAVHDTISHLRKVSVAHASKSVRYGERSIVKNDYFALEGDEVLTVENNFSDVARYVLRKLIAEFEGDVMTLFYGKNRTEADVQALTALVEELDGDIEVCVIATLDPIYDLTVIFE
jgi:dihydroxyacetone kinase-like predicted kinase